MDNYFSVITFELAELALMSSSHAVETHTFLLSVCLFLSSVFFHLFPSLSALCVLFYLCVSQGSVSQMSPLVTTSPIDLLPPALI